jgi:hypothetical protein
MLRTGISSLLLLLVAGCSQPTANQIEEATNDCLDMYRAKKAEIGNTVQATKYWFVEGRLIVKVVENDGDPSDDAITSGLCVVDLDEDEIEFASNTERARLER